MRRPSLRTPALAAFAAATVLFTACGNPSATTSPTAQGTSAAGLPAPEVSSVRVGVIETTTAHDFEVAYTQNLFSKYGITVDVHKFTGDGPLAQALAAGQVDFGLDTAGVGPIASQVTDVPLLVVACNKDNLGDILYSAHNITSASDLKGKGIAISSFGSETYGEALIAIKALGLTTDQVTITPIGNDGQRRAALAAGSVGASLNDGSAINDMTALGFNALLSLGSLSTGLPILNVVTQKSFAQKNPNTTLAVTAAMIEGNHIFLTDIQAAVDAAVKYEGADRTKTQALVVSDQAGWHPVNGIPLLADWTAAKQLYVKTDAALASVDPKSVFTTKFTDQLKSLGWYTKLGIPTS
ncbi:MAG TPA: ABC transporter substrate-binding protein [Candidatus Limnocylindrales bacterium]|nr:ABC transporter substrate-binding protein [Candidatus Limnocylindrales bacterium]